MLIKKTTLWCSFHLYFLKTKRFRTIQKAISNLARTTKISQTDLYHDTKSMEELWQRLHYNREGIVGNPRQILMKGSNEHIKKIKDKEIHISDIPYLQDYELDPEKYADILKKKEIEETEKTKP